jgi:hypothetical protein
MIDDALPPDCRSSIKNCRTVRPMAFRSKIKPPDLSSPQCAYFCIGNPRSEYFDSVTNLSADFSKTVESSPHHFTSRGPLFEGSNIFDARIYTFKTNTRHIVWA